MYVTTLGKTPVKLDFHDEFNKIVRKRVNDEIDDDAMDMAVFQAYNLTLEEIDYILTSDEVNQSLMDDGDVEEADE